LRNDINRIEDTVRDDFVVPGTLVTFACSAAGLFEELRLPRTVSDRVVVDLTPWVRPMVAVLDEYHRTCVAAVDRATARLWELYLGEMHPVGNVRARTLRKPDFAGWHGLVEHRVRNKADTLTRRHFHQVATVLDDLFRAEGYELLIVGGHQEDVPGFLEFLPKAIRPKVAGTFDIDEATGREAEIRRTAEGIVDRPVWTNACGPAPRPPSSSYWCRTAPPRREWSATSPGGWRLRGRPARCAACGRDGHPT